MSTQPESEPQRQPALKTEPTIQEVRDAMQHCARLLSESEEDTSEYIEAQTQMLNLAEKVGWNWEDDESLVRYCLKATSIECHEATVEAFEKWAAKPQPSQRPASEEDAKGKEN